MWYFAQVLWRCPGTSLATSTPSTFCWQPGIEPKTLCLPPQCPTVWATTAPHHHRPQALWSSYLPSDPISVPVCNSYEGRRNDKGSMLLYCLSLPVPGVWWRKLGSGHQNKTHSHSSWWPWVNAASADSYWFRWYSAILKLWINWSNNNNNKKKKKAFWPVQQQYFVRDL